HLVGQLGEHLAVQLIFGRGARRTAEELFGDLAQQGAALLAGGLGGEADQVVQAGVDFGLRHVGHGRSGSGTLATMPAPLRMMAGGGGGSARSTGAESRKNGAGSGIGSGSWPAWRCTE